MFSYAESSNGAKTGRARKSFCIDLERQLLSYATAAGAACMVALVPTPAAAEIVYTPADIVATNTPFNLDINGDGIYDFKFYQRSSFRCGRNCSTSQYVYNTFFLNGLQASNGIVQGREPSSIRKLP